MRYKFSNQFETRRAGMALAVLMSAALSLPASAAEIWKVNVAKSSFTSGVSTLVLERDNGKAPQGIDAKENPAATTFFVVSKGKVYMATDEAADASSNNGIRTVDYTQWKGMRLVQIGDNVRSKDLCGFRCQSGLPDSRMTLTFIAKGLDASRQMGGILVFNK